MQKTRNYGIDLAKIFSMFLVVCTHIYMQGGTLAAEQYGTVGYYLASYFYSLVLCAVDCFVIVNGYVACESKFKVSRIIELWVTILFWSILVSCVVMALQPESRSLSEAVSMFFPILRGRYWFFNAYLVLFMFRPVLNHVIATLSEEKYKVMLFVIVCVFGFIPIFSLGNDVLKFSGGAEFCWFFMLYLIGGFIRRFGVPVKYKNGWNLIVLLVLPLLNVIYKFVVEHITMMIFGRAMYGDLLLLNSSPIVLGEAIFLFLFFSRIQIPKHSTGGKLIKFISPLVFSVYIIHVHPIIFWNSAVVGRFAPLADLNPIITTTAVCGFALVIYVVCIVLDIFRMKLFTLVKVKNLCDKIGNHITFWIYRLLKIERYI